MNGPVRCHECINRPINEPCHTCGTVGPEDGRVWPSVPAEQTRVAEATGIEGLSLTVTASFDVPFPGKYRMICQPLEGRDDYGRTCTCTETSYEIGCKKHDPDAGGTLFGEGGS